MYAKFQSYSVQSSVKIHHYSIVRGSMLLSVHVMNDNSPQDYNV
jgi:hypothetical protein